MKTFNKFIKHRYKTRTLDFSVVAFLALGSMCMPESINAQIVERPRPEEWNQLIDGARFMDRFLPMPDGKRQKGIWGTADVAERFVDNGIENPDTSFWGGNILKDKDGLYHLYVCGWPENSPKGHMFWPKSTVFHAVSKNLHGPYSIRQTIGKGHNPEAYMLDDGRIVIYVIDGYYIADSYDGPWEYKHFDFDTRDRRIIEGLSNLTFARRSDGSRLMVCRGGGVWISRDGIAPYRQITEERVYPKIDGRFEDPVVWRDSLQYHLIVNDWLGRIAYYERSLDGVHWVVEQGEAYVPGVSVHKDGYVENWFKYERLKVFQDDEGRVVQTNFAVIDTIKWNDLPNDNHSSKNICIPMNKGLLMEVLNEKPIDGNTRTIEVLIKGEKGFKPSKELDLSSLRFGSYNEVNFGRGSKAVDMKKKGKDVIITFDGKGSGIDADEFAPKLIGKNKKGEMVFGYAKLPYVNYRPAILSSMKPVYNADGKCVEVVIENFGLSDSKESNLTLTAADGTVLTADVPSLKPYAKTTVKLNADKEFKLDGCKVTVTTSGKVVHTQKW